MALNSLSLVCQADFVSVFEMSWKEEPDACDQDSPYDLSGGQAYPGNGRYFEHFDGDHETAVCLLSFADGHRQGVLLLGASRARTAFVDVSRELQHVGWKFRRLRRFVNLI